VSIRELLRTYGYAIGLLAITFAIAIGWFLLDGRVGLNLADEGFLWYGVEALARGEVPMRDFEAYDPGRYVWAAAWSFLLGHNLVALRLSCVLFQCLGVFAGLLAARRLSRNWLFLTGVALLLSAWMHPRYKVFEQSVALMAVYAAVLLLERPTVRRHFFIGVFGGLSAFVGRNHGAYHVLAFGLLITWAAWGAGWRAWLRRCLAWGGGLFAGYLPQLVMFVFIPGFFAAFLRYVRFVFAEGTNLSRRIEWPWLVPTDIPPLARAASLAEGCFYVTIVAFLVFAAIRVWQSRRDGAMPQRLVLAAGCVALPYAHYVFSRADIVHLARGAPPMTLGILALAFTYSRRGRMAAYLVTPVLIAATLLAQLSQIGLAMELLSHERSLYAVNVQGERMLMPSAYARTLVSAHHLATKLAKPDEAIFFAPHTPGLYPFTGRRSPTNQHYFVFPASRDVDQHLVDELNAANLQWAIIQNDPLDGRDDLRFDKTNPLVFEFLRRNFRPVALESLPQNMVLLRRLQEPHR